MKVSNTNNLGEGRNVFLERIEELEKFKSQIRKKRFVSIVAPQHVGKSSLIYNGLVPALKKGYMAKAGTHWKIANTIPENAPLLKLGEALTQPDILYNLKERVTPKFEEDVLKIIHEEEGLKQLYRQYEYVHGYNLLIIIDQFEDVFTESVSMKERDAFLRLLLDATEQEEYAIYVVLALDSEKYTEGITNARDLLYSESEGFNQRDIAKMKQTLDLLDEKINTNTYQLHTLNQKLLEAAIKEFALKEGGVIIDDDKCMKLVEKLYTVQYQLEQIPKILSTKSWNYWGVGHLKINKDKDDDFDGDDLQSTIDEQEMQGSSDIVLQANRIYESLDVFQRRIFERVIKIVLFKNANGKVVERPTEIEAISNIIPDANYEDLRKILRIAMNTKPLGLFSTRKNELEFDSKLKIADIGIKHWPLLDQWLQDDSVLVKSLTKASDDASTYFYNKSVSLWSRPNAKALHEAINSRSINDKWLLQYIHDPNELLAFLKESEANGPQTSSEPLLVFSTDAEPKKGAATTKSKKTTKKTVVKTKPKEEKAAKVPVKKETAARPKISIKIKKKGQ